MARGRSKQRGGGYGGRKNGNKKSFGKSKPKSSKKRDSSHFKESNSSDAVERSYGSTDKRRKLEATQPKNQASSDEESVEEQPFDHFKQLLSTFSGFNENAQQNAIDSESDESESDADSSLVPEATNVSKQESDPDSEHDSDVDSEEESDLEEQETSDTDQLDKSGFKSQPKTRKATSNKHDSSEDDVEEEAEDEEDDEEEQDEDEDVEDEDEDENVDDDEVNEDEEDEAELQESLENQPDVLLDPFVRHVFYDMDEPLYESVSKVPQATETHHHNWPVLGQLVVRLPKLEKSSQPQTVVQKPAASLEEEKKFTEPGTIPHRIHDMDLSKLYIKSQIQENILRANASNLGEGNSGPFTPLQTELFSIINNYQDLYFPSRTLENGEEVRFAYCLHAVNHVLKTRDKVMNHNAKISRKGDVPDEFRDQGLMRPKVLILVPFRDSALRVIKMIIAILFKEVKANVEHMKRFVDEHTGNEIGMPVKKPRPEDYEQLFTGNTDDTFRIGMTITRKSLKLYADFYSADIIVASPLGLRVIVGAEGEHERDFDFLASLELLVLDQTELFLMQNWDHLLHVMDHMHLQPKDSHGTDFARVRSWALNGWARYYRQTLLFSSLPLPEMNALFNKKCHNYAGNVRVINPVVTGSICQIVVQLPQVFHRFVANSPSEVIDARFDMFVKKILPQFKESIMNRVLVYVPSYFDFVHIRNYFKREDTSFVQICEYTAEKKTSRARDFFFHGDVHFMLYSERAHFFRRMRIKGIRHLVFYQPPTFPHFYSEMCNLLHESNQGKSDGIAGNRTVTVLYSKYDVQQLTALVGTDRAKTMVSSTRNVHMFVTGE